MLSWVGVACFGFIAIFAVQEQLKVKKDRERKLLEICNKNTVNEERAKADER